MMKDASPGRTESDREQILSFFSGICRKWDKCSIPGARR